MATENTKSAVERAREFGIDISLTEENLRRTPTERIEALLSVLQFIHEARISLTRHREKQTSGQNT